MPAMPVLPVVLMLVCASAAAERWSERKEVQDFANEMSASHGFDAQALLRVLDGAEYQQSIIDAISRPAEKRLSWAEYQKIFLTDSRVAAGREFALQYADVLARAEAKYGVPRKVVVAVIGVETMYGKHKGRYRVLDALTTLGFDYPPRSKFFRRELGEFLLLAREEAMAPDALLGSYAGAMGWGQFIPSSYRAYAVDFNDDGARDIWDDPEDAIGSVAAYLARHGWLRGEPVTFPLTAEVPEDMLDVSLEPFTTIGALRGRGVRVGEAFGDAERVSAMRLAGTRGDEYWVGLRNFYVITRYNHSKLYAMAVHQLSERIAGG